jgi:hypothetical protein
MLELKVKLIERITKEIGDKILETEKSYQLAKESRDSDTKSSAGDKYETGREMMQKEMDKNLALINQYKQQLIELNKGSSKFIRTSQGDFIVCIGLGKLVIEGKNYFAISWDSPVGQQLKGKNSGDSYVINGKEFKIESIC